MLTGATSAKEPSVRTNPPRLLPLLFGFFLLSATLATTAHADVPPEPEPDVVAPPDHAKTAIDRTWLYADDAHIAAPMTLIAMGSTSYTAVGAAPFRIGSVTVPTRYTAFDSNTAQPGVMFTVGGELGLFSRVSVMAAGQLGLDGENGTNGGAIVGVRVQAFPSRWTHAHLVFSAGYLRESWEGPVFDDDTGKWHPGNPNGDNGMWIRGAISGDVGRTRLVGNFHAEHVFADGRDPLDIMVDLGVTYRIVDGFRAGLEWVGQDLEETFSPGAEGGARMFGGPIASLQLFQDRLTLVGGPAIGLSQVQGNAPDFVARLGVSYGF
jgi:hypothetical protein